MTCPKCGSKNVSHAPEEAPAWAKSWTKCFACGKRWNLDGGPPTSEDDERADDLITKVLKTAREQASKKEFVMSRTSSKRQCTFITIRGMQCSQASTRGETRCKYHLGKIQESAPQLPAHRATAPIVLAEPQVINPRPSANGGRLLTLQRGIEQCEADLAILRSAKEVLERFAG